MKTAILLFALIGSIGAQVPTGTIAGVIVDPSGAPVPGARLKVVNLATNIARVMAIAADLVSASTEGSMR